MKSKLYKNGASVTFEKLHPSGMYLVQLRAPSGDLHDKIRVDEYRMACEYYRAFQRIARGL